MAERPRDACDFKGLVTLKLNFRLKGYVSRQYLWSIRWRNSYLYYNFAAGSFHTKNFVADFIRLKLQKIAF